MVGAQAFLMDNNYESYYGMNSYDGKQSYGKDSNSYDKSKHSNVKCNNINVNVNGFNGVEVGTLPTPINGLGTEAQTADESEIGASSFESDGGRPSGSDGDSRVVCIYNNNNVVNDETDQCADIEACFEDNLFPQDFGLLTNALKNGITVEIDEGNSVSLNSFADICEVLEGLSPLVVEGVILQILQAANIIGLPIDLVTCIAEVLDIQIIER